MQREHRWSAYFNLPHRLNLHELADNIWKEYQKAIEAAGWQPGDSTMGGFSIAITFFIDEKPQNERVTFTTAQLAIIENLVNARIEQLLPKQRINPALDMGYEYRKAIEEADAAYEAQQAERHQQTDDWQGKAWGNWTKNINPLPPPDDKEGLP